MAPLRSFGYDGGGQNAFGHAVGGGGQRFQLVSAEKINLKRNSEKPAKGGLFQVGRRQAKRVDEQSGVSIVDSLLNESVQVQRRLQEYYTLIQYIAIREWVEAGDWSFRVRSKIPCRVD